MARGYADGTSKKLTTKQQDFVNCLLSGMSQREAYKASYNASKTKDRVIDVKACELFAKPHVKAAYERLKEIAIQQAEEEGIINAKKVLKHIASIAYDDIGKHIEFGINEDDELYLIPKKGDNIKTQNIKDIYIDKNGNLRLKLYDRDTALYKLAEHLGVDKPKNDETDNETLDKLDKILQGLDNQAVQS